VLVVVLNTGEANVVLDDKEVEISNELLIV